MKQTTKCRWPVMPVAMLVSVVILSGCGTSKEAILPAGDNTMLALWQNKAPSGQPSVQARETLRRPLTQTEQRGDISLAESYSRTQESEISQQFPRLPNPDMVMYVFPHLAGGSAPVPGYSTVFPFYTQTQYALPGERTEAL
ncbi:TIGR03751 family conjugal transfer lipoprotein [Salmonella enterica subsp. enterica serovar Oranienburg]|uniref:TIGR03751 family conjugal transfer lipoprotein n=1 Tax=Salmonella enterica TaxID=28901 RepID=UPI0008FD2444|nr:TIGR03751 family conjugal transfer lipoprotein [Salmonella enterica]EAA8931061.1 TIGR03751 family conjugal transfer lipoprotein [Salmonella enterica subsp. enterica serovar Gaminara]EAA9480885.1 TIGR03751 family conjugal transfer lipoprotein [Salmonella enterica subsp. enterica]EAS6829355.1 TIGR03751 family conjugal transfer lipoprotein [Salmonella enterica subsp. enterica serovar Give]ECE0527402.1 TIGR03751 family conjugal transfer lipoprotein [Salmonella enterica subsp. salamae]EEB1575914